MRKSKFFKKLKDEDQIGSLPVPRLQFLNTFHEPVDGYNLSVEYSLVTSHLIDPDFKIILGVTKVGYNPKRDPEPFYEPFRESAHIRHDMWVLNLRGFIIQEGKHKEIDLNDESSLPNALISKMRAKK